MKHSKAFFVLLAFLGLHGTGAFGQTSTQNAAGRYLQISLRGGYDLPFYENNTPDINYKGSLSTGLSADYYFGRWGIGVDVDYIKNKPKSTTNINSLQNISGVNLTGFSLTETGITRGFVGIGPSYKYAAGKLMGEFNARVGLGLVKGGKVQLNETTTTAMDVLNFHAGYDEKSLLTSKLQVRLNYFINSNIAVQGGAYYIRHFGASELVDPVLGYSARVQPIKNLGANNVYDGGAKTRLQSCNCDISSIGFFAGISFKLGSRKKVDPDKCLPEYSLVVTAKDKITGEVIPGTLVTIKSKSGLADKSGITNNYGVVVFDNIKPYDYDIDGAIGKIEFEGNNAATDEFMKRKTVQKTILYGSRNFIVKGKIYECNSSKPIPGINVVIGKTDLSYVEFTLSKEDGSYMLQIPEGTGDYSLYGKKDRYYSQIEVVNPANYNREKNLFIRLEICAERVECGNTLLLKNILFDLDKYTIKPAAAKELDKLVQFMKDNPSVKVELSSHTDCRNTAEYNMTLSQNRANASVDYLVSRGIDRSRLIGKGYGETRLLNECADGVNCPEDKHAVNRRTEMKVICEQ